MILHGAQRLKLVTDFDLHCNIPQLLVIKSRNRRTTVNKRTCFFSSFNCLKRAGINTVEDLVSKSEDEMMKVRNLGRKSLEEVI